MTASVAQFGDAAHAVHVAFVAAPDGQRRAPVAVARQRPVDVVLEPLAKAAVFDVLGVPGHGLVGGQQIVLDRRRLHIPGRLGVVEQRRVAAPAERVAVLVRHLGQQQATGREVGDDAGVGVFDEHLSPGLDLGDEASGGVDRIDHRQVVVDPDAHVVFAEGRRDVHDAGAVANRDVAVADHIPGAPVGRHEPVGRFVLEVQQRAAGDDALDHGLGAEHRLDQVAGQHEALAAALDEGVVDLGIDGAGDVGDQGPGRGRPDGQAHPVPTAARGRPARPRRRRRLDAVAVRGGGGRRRSQGRDLRGRGGGQRKAHVDRRLGDVVIALRHLVAGDRRAAARAVGHDLEALVEELAVPDLPQQPPHRLDVVVGERVVGVVEIDPEADALGHAVPVLEIGEHALAAQGVEPGDAVLLDLLLAVDPQTALDFELDGQAVAVPAGLARHAEAAHGLEAREDVLEDARQHVVRARAAVGRGRTLVERVERRVAAQLDALLEDALAAPELEDAGIEGGKVDLGRDLAEPGRSVVHRRALLVVADGTAPARPCLKRAKDRAPGR